MATTFDIKDDKEPTRAMVCKLAGLHVSDMLNEHWNEIRARAERTPEGKKPTVKVSFSVAFDPTANAPRVVTKYSLASRSIDETEDVADPKQMKLLDDEGRSK